MKKTSALLLCLISFSLSAQTGISIIPLPKVVQENKGVFLLDNKTSISYNHASLRKLVSFAQEALKESSKLNLGVTQVSKAPVRKSVYLKLDPALQGKTEAYTMDVSAAGVVITANNEHGLFYGLQTLVQLIPVKGGNKIPAVHIEDEPRYNWRGMMLDVCRHKWSVDFIKKFIDQLAYHKLNKFHWHLTEDQGWRIEIKKYPLLQEVAAYRNGTLNGPNWSKDIDSIRYGGFYTQDQIREVVAYAGSRYIEVIPEIEMPGHSVAAITAYPYLACNDLSFETGKPHEVRKVWGVSKDILCAGNDSVFTFLEDVLTEVMPLFSSKYMHIGGDEAPHEAWAKCPKCQQRMKDEGLKNEAELQSWFIRRMEKFINSKGKKIIGWEEIMDGGLTPTATVHSWLGTTSGLKASKMGNDVIMSPNSHMYFDAYQAEPKLEPKAIGNFTPLEKVYSFEPRHPEMTDKDAAHLLGAQANLWTEYITTEDYLQYMMNPRIDALSELTWSAADRKDYKSFQTRLKTQLQRYDAKNINYRIPTPEVRYTYSADSMARISLENVAVEGVIRYETDQAKVTDNSPVYRVPIDLKKGSVLHFSVFLPNGRQSTIEYFPKKTAVKR